MSSTTHAHSEGGYTSEPVSFPQLETIDVRAIAASVTEPYRNMVLNQVNTHCLRLAVFEGDYRWHLHPTSDELFLVVDGCLVIELADGRALQLLPWQAATVPAGTVHRTRAIGRTVNLCFEALAADVQFVDDPRGPAQSG